MWVISFTYEFDQYIITYNGNDQTLIIGTNT